MTISIWWMTISIYCSPYRYPIFHIVSPVDILLMSDLPCRFPTSISHKLDKCTSLRVGLPEFYAVNLGFMCGVQGANVRLVDRCLMVGRWSVEVDSTKTRVGTAYGVCNQRLKLNMMKCFQVLLSNPICATTSC